MPDSALLFVLVVLAAATASVSFTPLLAGHASDKTLQLVETTVGTTVFCTSIGLIFHRYGVAAGAGALAAAWLVNRSLASSSRGRADRICAWASAAALLAYLSQI